MGRVHASGIDGFHGKGRIGCEAIVVLDRRLVVGIVGSIWAPGRMLVLKGLLVEVMVVIHVQLTHDDLFEGNGLLQAGWGHKRGSKCPCYTEVRGSRGLEAYASRAWGELW